MKERLSDEEIYHPLNEPLLEEAAKIKEERIVLRQRIDKLDQCQGGVSPGVYQRVRTDYLAQLNKAMERLVALKKNLEAEQKTLLEKKIQVESKIKSHNENIEESQLRQSLGEYSASQHQDLAGRETDEMGRLTEALQILNEAIERHQTIFEGEEFVKNAAGPRSVPPLPALPPQKIRTSPKAIPVPPPIQPAPVPDITTLLDVGTDDRTDRFASPTALASSGRGAELLVMDEGKVVQMVPLGRTIVIGRSPSNDVILKEPKVSRKHAEIQYAGGKYILLDLESSNGTFVSGKKVTEQVLQPGDEIVIGNTKMVFKI